MFRHWPEANILLIKDSISKSNLFCDFEPSYKIRYQINGTDRAMCQLKSAPQDTWKTSGHHMLVCKLSLWGDIKCLSQAPFHNIWSSSASLSGLLAQLILLLKQKTGERFHISVTKFNMTLLVPLPILTLTSSGTVGLSDVGSAAFWGHRQHSVTLCSDLFKKAWEMPGIEMGHD